MTGSLWKRRAAIALALLLLIGLTLRPHAQGEGYRLSWFALFGGTQSSGEDYALVTVAGQPGAGVWSGGDYTLYGGFLHPGHKVILAAVHQDSQ